MKLEQRRLLFAIGIFWAITITAILINSAAYIGTSRPWFSGNSISWYVGSQAWSALLFALGNLIVAISMSHFLWGLGLKLKMPRAYFFFITLLVVALVWLSAFPLGFFDTLDSKSTVSCLHEAGSRMMFFAMAIVTSFLATKAQLGKPLRIVSGLFVGYAVFCALAVVTGFGKFYAALLFFEAFYIFAFMMLVLGCSQKRIN